MICNVTILNKYLYRLSYSIYFILIEISIYNTMKVKIAQQYHYHI